MPVPNDTTQVSDSVVKENGQPWDKYASTPTTEAVAVPQEHGPWEKYKASPTVQAEAPKQHGPWNNYKTDEDKERYSLTHPETGELPSAARSSADMKESVLGKAHQFLQPDAKETAKTIPTEEEEQYLSQHPEVVWVDDNPQYPNRQGGMYYKDTVNSSQFNDPRSSHFPIDLHLGKHTYEGAKQGAMAAFAPMALEATVPEIVGGYVGSEVGRRGAAYGAKKIGLGDTGQYIAGEAGEALGTVAGAGLGKIGVPTSITASEALEHPLEATKAGLREIPKPLGTVARATDATVGTVGRGLLKRIPLVSKSVNPYIEEFARVPGRNLGLEPSEIVAKDLSGDVSSAKERLNNAERKLYNKPSGDDTTLQAKSSLVPKEEDLRAYSKAKSDYTNAVERQAANEELIPRERSNTEFKNAGKWAKVTGEDVPFPQEVDKVSRSSEYLKRHAGPELSQDLAGEEALLGGALSLPKKSNVPYGTVDFNSTRPSVRSFVPDREITPEVIQEIRGNHNEVPTSEKTRARTQETPGTAQEPEAARTSRTEEPVDNTRARTSEPAQETPARSPEAMDAEPNVRTEVSALSDENLKKLAKAHGIDPEAYDFKLRDEGRHRTDRDQLTKDITSKMGDDEVLNLQRNVEKNEKTFSDKDRTGSYRAEKASKSFPRLRGPVDEFGNPIISGGSQGADETPLQHDQNEINRLAREFMKTGKFEDPNFKVISHEGESEGLGNINIGGRASSRGTAPRASTSSEDLQTEAARFTQKYQAANRLPSKQDEDIEALSSAKKRLGLGSAYARTSSPETLGDQTPLQKAPERLAARANTSYSVREVPGEVSNKLYVEALDSKGNSVAKVAAIETLGEPGVYTVRMSVTKTPGNGVGTEAYAKLARTLEQKATTEGNTITMKGDVTQSDAAKRVWEHLKRSGYDVQYEKGTERPSIVFKPKERAALEMPERARSYRDDAVAA